MLVGAGGRQRTSTTNKALLVQATPLIGPVASVTAAYSPNRDRGPLIVYDVLLIISNVYVIDTIEYRIEDSKIIDCGQCVCVSPM
jgi:hypothetical protein